MDRWPYFRHQSCFMFPFVDAMLNKCVSTQVILLLLGRGQVYVGSVYISVNFAAWHVFVCLLVFFISTGTTDLLLSQYIRGGWKHVEGNVYRVRRENRSRWENGLLIRCRVVVLLGFCINDISYIVKNEIYNFKFTHVHPLSKLFIEHLGTWGAHTVH